MNKSRTTPTPLNTNLNSTSINGLILNCAPCTPNSTSSANGTSTNQLNLQCLTNSSISPSNDASNTTPVSQQQQNTVTNLSHSTNTNFSNNQINSPYHDHSDLNSPLLMNSFNNDLTTGGNFERLNGSLNSLGSNSSSSINSNSGSGNSQLTFNSANNNLKKIASLTNAGNSLNDLANSLANDIANSLTNGLNNSPNFTSNRENINYNNVQWIEFHQMKQAVNTTTNNSHLDNVPTPPNSLMNATTATFPAHQSWRLGNLLETNHLCNTNALLSNNNDGYDYQINYTNV